MNQITIYGVSAFDINSAELVDVLKINNNGEICDDENGYSYQFSNISKIAGVLGIRIVGEASPQGTLAPVSKCRGEAKSLTAMLN